MSDTSPSFRALDFGPVCPWEADVFKPPADGEAEGCDDSAGGFSDFASEDSAGGCCCCLDSDGDCWDSEVLRYLRLEGTEDIEP